MSTFVLSRRKRIKSESELCARDKTGVASSNVQVTAAQIRPVKIRLFFCNALIFNTLANVSRYSRKMVNAKIEFTFLLCVNFLHSFSAIIADS